MKRGTFRISAKSGTVQATSIDGTELEFPVDRLSWYSVAAEGCRLCYDIAVSETSFVVKGELKPFRVEGFAVGKTDAGKVLINRSKLKEDKHAVRK